MTSRAFARRPQFFCALHPAGPFRGPCRSRARFGRRSYGGRMHGVWCVPCSGRACPECVGIVALLLSPYALDPAPPRSRDRATYRRTTGKLVPVQVHRALEQKGVVRARQQRRRMVDLDSIPVGERRLFVIFHRTRGDRFSTTHVHFEMWANTVHHVDRVPLDPDYEFEALKKLAPFNDLRLTDTVRAAIEAVVQCVFTHHS